MNKYQEALATMCYKCHIHSSCKSKNCVPINILLELVDKATPNKPSYEADGYDENGELIYDTWICPNCDKKYEVDYDEYDHCPNCGQAIDWSDEE